MRLIPLVGLFSALPLAVLAGPLTWNLVGVTLSDGGSASGAFVFNADTVTFSAIHVTTTAGSLLGGTTYSFFCASPCTGLPADSVEILLLSASSSSDLTGDEAMRLTFFPALTDAGGTASLTGLEAACSNSTCSTPTGTERVVSFGSVSTVPEPSSALLFAACAALLGALGSRQRNGSPVPRPGHNR
jgi:hypothetical protein